MANPKNTKGITIQKTTYDKLTKIKKDNTYNDIIEKLIKMDQKYNINKTIEYEFETENTCKSFKIIFEGNQHTILYYGKKGFEDNISAWSSYPPIPDEDKELFIKFIILDSNINRLKDLEFSEDFGKFTIYKR